MASIMLPAVMRIDPRRSEFSWYQKIQGFSELNSPVMFCVGTTPAITNSFA